MQQALFGGGCFWCVEAVYLELQGIHKVTSGYAGGDTDNPTYEDICRGDTNHAEVIHHKKSDFKSRFFLTST